MVIAVTWPIYNDGIFICAQNMFDIALGVTAFVVALGAAVVAHRVFCVKAAIDVALFG